MRLLIILGMLMAGLTRTMIADEAKPPVEPKPISLAKWHLSLQKDAGKVLPGKTKAEHEAIVADHIAKFQNEHSTALVEFTVKIRQIAWKDGIATITTTDELPPQQKGVIELKPRQYALAFLMDQSTATGIKPGTPIKVVAKLHVVKSARPHNRYDKVAQRTIVRWQAFYNVNNTRLNCWLGGYCSGDYSAEIAGQTYPGAYTDPPEFE